MGILRFGVLIFLILSVYLISSPKELALEGVALLERSRATWFPLFKILYFYVGLQRLSMAVNISPEDLEIRLIRAEELFKFSNSEMARKICEEDLTFIMLNAEKDREISKKLDLVYYMFAVLMMKDGRLEEARLILEKLESEGSPYAEILREDLERSDDR